MVKGVACYQLENFLSANRDTSIRGSETAVFKLNSSTHWPQTCDCDVDEQGCTIRIDLNTQYMYMHNNSQRQMCGYLHDTVNIVAVSYLVTDKMCCYYTVTLT